MFKIVAFVACLTTSVVFWGCKPQDGNSEEGHVHSASCPCCAGVEQKGFLPVETLVTLPEDKVNMPDGMCLMGDGSFLLSVPNFEDHSLPPILARITADNKFETFYELPPHPVTGRVGPMGIGKASNGDIYLADMQLFNGEKKEGQEKADPLFEQSRLLRIVMKDGQPTETKVVAEGINVANAVAFKDGYVYVSDTILEPGTDPLVSGVFRFKLDEENVKVTKPFREDAHFLKGSEIKTKNVKIGFGADGLAFDSNGNLYIGNFSDGIVHKLTFDEEGNVASNEVFGESAEMKSSDGLFYNKADDRIYVADMVANAVHAISVKDGKVQTLAVCEDNDGSKGIDSPCEAIVRGNEVIVSNMDMICGKNTKRDLPCELSVIKLPEEKEHDHADHDHDHNHEH